MTREQRLKLDVGDRVNWMDPDAAECSGNYRITEILTPTGRVIDMNSVLVLCSGAEVYVSELV